MVVHRKSSLGWCENKKTIFIKQLSQQETILALLMKYKFTSALQNICKATFRLQDPHWFQIVVLYLIFFFWQVFFTHSRSKSNIKTQTLMNQRRYKFNLSNPICNLEIHVQQNRLLLLLGIFKNSDEFLKKLVLKVFIQSTKSHK